MALFNDSFGVIAPRITGSLSAISSSLIIFIIFRSTKKLRTIYHRLMFAISFADILGSIAMALTTLPMPDIPGSDEIEGTRLGNIQTCEAQGFFFVFGVFTMFTYNGMLCVYYTCVIAFGMEEQNVTRRVEPFLHLFSLSCGLGAAVPPLFLEMYNPTGTLLCCSIFNDYFEFFFFHVFFFLMPYFMFCFILYYLHAN